MSKYGEKIVKLEGLVLDRKNYLYYVKEFEDGVYLCRSMMKARRRKGE